MTLYTIYQYLLMCYKLKILKLSHKNKDFEINVADTQGN